MKKCIIRSVLALLLVISLAMPYVFAGDAPNIDPDAPVFVLGIAFEAAAPRDGDLPAKSIIAVSDTVSADISWSRSEEGWDDSMPFVGGYEYTMKIHAQTIHQNYYIKDWVLNAGNMIITFRDAESGICNTVSPTDAVLLDDHNLLVYYTFTLESEPKTPFTDVEVGSETEAAVEWALENGVTNGTSDTTFSPEDTCTRAQAVTFLWRAMGCPEPQSTEHSFGDVKEADYFYKSVLWAVENGITDGTSKTTFSPEKTCSAAHIITFLHRANGRPVADGESELAARYPNTWYTDALAWADSTGLLSGMDENFSPENDSPRADVVMYLYRNAEK